MSAFKSYQIFYKLLFGGREPLLSYCSSGVAKVSYRTNEWAEAPQWLAEQGYHLLVFETKRDVSRFCSSDNPLVYTCICEDEIRPMPAKCDIFEIDHGILLPLDGGTWPAGTRMFKRVKLLERIYI